MPMLEPARPSGHPHRLANPGGPSSQDLQAHDRLRVLMRGGSKSFFAASLMLPARVRAPATALYAFCRLADDAIDLGADPSAAMRDLVSRLDALYDGRPRAIDADIALAGVVHRHAIPRALPDALLEGFLWDTQKRCCETLADTEAYAARVAATVGAMMSLVMGAASPTALARACDLGVAMQLTNIARDVGEDARAGRLYLPRQWLREAGIDIPAWLAQPVFNPAIAGVIERLLRHADMLYQRSEHGIAELPRDCRPAIRAARLVYAEIGEQLRREGLDSISRRVVVTKQRKLALMARAAGAAVVSSGQAGAALPVLPAVQFLVDAAAVASPPVTGRAAARRPVGERLGWVIALHEREAIARQEARGMLN
jgi:phytoene synthase